MFFDVAQLPLLYVLAGIGIALVVVMAAISAKKAYKRLEEDGVTKKELSSLIRSSAIFSIVPSISIVIGLLSLSALIGVPWAWWRLSVIGNVMYETLAASMGMQAMGFDSFANASANTFGAVMFVMTLGIIFGIVFLIVAGKPLMLGYAKQEKKGTWGFVFNSCFMLAMFAVFVPAYFVQGPVYLLTFVSAMLISLLITFLAKKTGQKWLGQFNLAFCLIIGMCLSVLFARLFS